LSSDLVALFTEVLPYLLLAGLALWFLQQNSLPGVACVQEVLPWLLLAGLALWLLQQKCPCFAPAPVQVDRVPTTKVVSPVYAPISSPVQVETPPTIIQAPAVRVVSTTSAPVVPVVAASPARSVYVPSNRGRSPAPVRLLTPCPAPGQLPPPCPPVYN
jgi:hypothetical protein